MAARQSASALGKGWKSSFRKNQSHTAVEASRRFSLTVSYAIHYAHFMNSLFSRCVIVASLLALGAATSSAQWTFSDSSRLRSPDYLLHGIKAIRDGDLFSSIRLDAAGLTSVARAVEGRDFVKAYQAWADYWGTKQQPRYIMHNYQLLLDTDVLMGYDDLRAYGAKHPDERDSILARAALVVKNVIRAWGDVVIDFGSRVNFNREVGQSGKYGFHYWGWSKPLNAAFVLTGDQTYLAKFDELFHRWYEQRNAITRGFPELDVVYYELGLGVRNRMFIEYYLLPYTNRPWQTHERMLKTVLGAARWLYELERWEGYRSGNWQIHGSYMLVQIALTFPEFKESEEWLRLGLQRLEEHREHDFFEDGGHLERAPRNYTLATYLSYRNLYFLLNAHTAQLDVAQRIRRSIGKTIDWWITMLAPTGEVPAINDSHRGLFPVYILQDGAEFFNKPEVYGVLRNLFGVSGSRARVTLPPFTSRHMPASGFTVMRTDWTREALYMNINYGKWNGAHTHNDLLDFEIYAYGKALAVDAGLGLTYDDPLYIPWYKSSRAHNMVVVNDRNMERETVEGENILWSSTPSLDYFAGEHRGYANLGVRHRRHIAFVKPRYWVVLDQIKCEKGGDTLSWYLHTPTRLVRFRGGYRSSTAPGILILPDTSELRSRTGKCTAASTDDLTPGKTQEIEWVAYDQQAAASSTREFSILLYPFKVGMPDVNFGRLAKEHFCVQGPSFRDDLYVPALAYDDGEIATDAVFLLIHREDGQAARFSLVNGTFVKVKGRMVWKSSIKTSAEGELND